MLYLARAFTRVALDALSETYLSPSSRSGSPSGLHTECLILYAAPWRPASAAAGRLSRTFMVRGPSAPRQRLISKPMLAFIPIAHSLSSVPLIACTQSPSLIPYTHVASVCRLQVSTIYSTYCAPHVSALYKRVSHGRARVYALTLQVARPKWIQIHP